MAENDFSEKINQLLSNPEALMQVMSLAKNFLPLTQTAAPVSAQPMSPPPAYQPTSPPPAYQPAGPPPAYQPVSSPAPGPQQMYSQPVYSPQPNAAPAYAPPISTPQTPAASAPDHDSAVPAGLLLDKLQPILSSGAKHPGSDRRCTLLKAIKPYLKNERAEKVDMLIKVLQITDLAQSTFKLF